MRLGGPVIAGLLSGMCTSKCYSGTVMVLGNYYVLRVSGTQL